MMYRFWKHAAAMLLAAVLLLGTARAEAMNVLLVGVDSEDGAGRSDTMMLARVDAESGEVRLVSFLRDLYVSIPGFGRTRLNAAYVYGGVELLKSTLNETFGVEADRTVTVDFSLLRELVDAVGGVEVHLTRAEAGQINKELDGSALTEGTALLNGEQALCYSRIRKIDSDFQRTARQQTVIAALLKRAGEMDLFSLARLATRFLGKVQTDMTLADVAALMPLVRHADEWTLETARVPFAGAYSDETIGGMQVLVPDLAANRRKLAAFLEP